ncbi:TasA family protein [Anaeromassilibacillus senegalensis]|uniref:TasA family protein n=1 Tax=Anaeromassilibacillus senegalensis TaxID=1673717 RepID=UPI0006829024|nr:TasA family protein [Anaeromassilibacillus senegalensis]
MKTKKSRILLSVVSVLLVFSLLVGGTMAWFTDTEKVDANFTAGILDINVKPDIENQATLEFKNLRPMQYDNFYAELNAAGGANNVAANEMDENDFAPAPVYFQPVKITNDGTLPVKYEISVEDIGAQNDMVKNVLKNDEGGVYQPKDQLEIPCEEAPYILKDVLKIFVYKNVNNVWTLVEGVNLNSVTAKADKEEDVYKADAIMPAKGEETYVIAGYLPEGVTNEYQGKHFHGNVVVNAYQPDSTEGASSGGSSEPEVKDIPITIHYTLADGTKVGNDYQITAKSDAFPYTVTEAKATPGLPKGYHFADPEQSYESTLTGDTASDVTFIVEKDEEPVPEYDVTINFYDVINENSAGSTVVKVSETTVFNKDNLVLPEKFVLFPESQSYTVTVENNTVTPSSITVNVVKMDGDSIVLNTKEGVWNVGKDMTAKYVMENDITLARGWEVLGLGSNTDTSFTGTFDGAGYTISGLHSVKNDYNNIGLFALNNGTIKNLNLSVNQMEGSQYVGTVAGQNEASGVISNVHVTGNYVGALSKGSDGGFAGGIVGVNRGVMEDCSSNIKGSGVTRGVVAYNYAGGIAGGNYGTIRTSYALGGINSGYVNDINAGNVSTYYAGGLVGGNTGTIENCYANVGDYIAGVQNVGGFAGLNGSTGQIRNCYVIPNDKVYGGTYNSTISIGKNSGSVSNSYAESTTSGTVNGFTRRTKAQMTSSTALNGFDASIWNFTAGSYPDLVSNPRA